MPLLARLKAFCTLTKPPPMTDAELAAFKSGMRDYAAGRFELPIRPENQAAYRRGYGHGQDLDPF